MLTVPLIYPEGCGGPARLRAPFSTWDRSRPGAVTCADALWRRGRKRARLSPRRDSRAHARRSRRTDRGRSGRPGPVLAMHKHTARLPACLAVVGIADVAEALDTRAPSRRSAR